MDFLDTYFLNHLKENNITYLQHFIISFQIGTYLFFCSTKSIIHAFVPYFFQNSNKECVKCLNYLLTIFDNN